MKNLLALLERFSTALHRDALTKETIVRIIHEQTNVSVLPELTTLKDGLLTLSASPAAHNEMKLKEEALRAAFKTARVPVTRILYK